MLYGILYVVFLLKVVICFGTQVYDNVNAQRKAQKRTDEKRKQE